MLSRLLARGTRGPHSNIDGSQELPRPFRSGTRALVQRSDHVTPGSTTLWRPYTPRMQKQRATDCACFHSTPSACIWRQCAANDRVFSRRAPAIEDEIRQRLLTPREKLRTGRTCFARARAPLSSTSSRSDTSISVGGLDCPRPSIPSPTRKACTPLQPRRRGVRLKAQPCHGRLHNSTQHFPVRREKERAASESTYASVTS